MIGGMLSFSSGLGDISFGDFGDMSSIKKELEQDRERKERMKIVEVVEETKDAGLFGERSSFFDFCLEVEGKQLFAPRNLLSMMSPIFERLCQERYFKDGEGKVLLVCQKHDEVLTMLRCMIPHPSVDPITDGNLEVVMRMGHFYEVPFLVDAASGLIAMRLQLLHHQDPASYRYLKLASSYQLYSNEIQPLIRQLIQKVSNLPIHVIVETDYELSDRIKGELYKHIELKRHNGRHAVGKKQKVYGSFHCHFCLVTVQYFSCDYCNTVVCPQCLGTVNGSYSPCSLDKLGLCRTCGKRACLC